MKRTRRAWKQVVTDTVHKIWELDSIALRMEERAEPLGLSGRQKREHDRIMKRSERMKAKLISDLMKRGLCSSPDGLTSDESSNDIFSDVGSKLWIIGNGEWC